MLSLWQSLSTDILRESGCIYITVGDPSIISFTQVHRGSIVSMPWEKVVNLIIELLYKTAANSFSPTLFFFFFFIPLFDTFCKDFQFLKMEMS